ncbi:hypothetical protein GF389_02230 [Candidatus Dojkabacteria bacterium]|nr:hypothetical protein [Candidatus Dojkabacteria bacterium]
MAKEDNNKPNKSKSKHENENGNENDLNNEKTSDVKHTETDSTNTEKANQRDFRKFEPDRGGFSCAFILIAIGILLLLNSTGVVSWDIWASIWRLWPFVFIIWGVEMIIGKNSLLNCLFGCFTAFAFLLFIILAVVASDDKFETWVDENIGISLENVALIKDPEYIEEEYVIEDNEYPEINRRVVELDFGAGEYKLTDENSLEYLEADLKYAKNYETPEWSVEEKRESLQIGFETKQKFGAIFASYDNKYDLNFGRSDVETDLSVKLGAGRGEVRFDRLDMDLLKLELGAGELDATLGSGAIPNEISIDIGAGDATLIIPEDVELDVEYDIGAGELEIDGKSYGGDGDFTQELENGFETLKIKVNIGAGKLMIDRI